MATVNPRTIILKKIRRRIRTACDWRVVDGGMPHFYTTENYKGSRLVKDPAIGRFPYYVKSDRAIKDIAEKILEEVEEYVRR